MQSNGVEAGRQREGNVASVTAWFLPQKGTTWTVIRPGDDPKGEALDRRGQSDARQSGVLRRDVRKL